MSSTHETVHVRGTVEAAGDAHEGEEGAKDQPEDVEGAKPEGIERDGGGSSAS